MGIDKLFLNLPTYAAYKHVLYEFSLYLNSLRRCRLTNEIIDKVQALANELFLNEAFLELIKETANEQQNKTDAQIACAIYERLHTGSKEFTQALIEFEEAIGAFALHDMAVEISQKILTRVQNLPKDGLDYKVYQLLWKVFTSNRANQLLQGSITQLQQALKEVAYPTLPASEYAVNFERARDLWSGNYFKGADLFSPFGTPTNMLGQDETSLHYVAFNKSDKEKQEDLMRYCSRGDVMLGILHYSPKPDNSAHAKLALQCKDVLPLIGIKGGVCSVVHPQELYEGGFPSNDFSLIFIKPKLPKALKTKERKAYMDNIRTWLVLVNMIASTPNRLPNNEVLQTKTLKELQHFGFQCLEALTGEAKAKQWLQERCYGLCKEEMVHIALNLGLHFPLNLAHMDEALFMRVEKALSSKRFLEKSKNPYLKEVDLNLAPKELSSVEKSLYLYTAKACEQPYSKDLAVEPFSMADIIDVCMQESIPRKRLGEGCALEQAEMLEEMRPMLKLEMQIDEEQEKAFELLYTRIIEVVKKEYESYYAFKQAFDEVLSEAQNFHMKSNKGVFMPAHCFMVRAKQNIVQDKNTGVLDWQYIGHGLGKNVLDKNS